MKPKPLLSTLALATTALLLWPSASQGVPGADVRNHAFEVTIDTLGYSGYEVIPSDISIGDKFTFTFGIDYKALERTASAGSSASFEAAIVSFSVAAAPNNIGSYIPTWDESLPLYVNTGINYISGKTYMSLVVEPQGGNSITYTGGFGGLAPLDQLRVELEIDSFFSNPEGFQTFGELLPSGEWLPNTTLSGWKSGFTFDGGFLGVSVHGYGVEVEAIPEPSTLLLTGAGLLIGLGLRRFRKRS